LKEVEQEEQLANQASLVNLSLTFIEDFHLEVKEPVKRIVRI
jgi:hypothetical protein